MRLLSSESSITWENSLFRELARLAWPITVSMLSYSLMTTVDTLFVSRLGAASLAGVGLGGILAFATICFGFGALRSVKVLISQALGAGELGQAAPILGAGLVWGLLLGSSGLALGLLLAFLLPEFTASRAAGDQASRYLFVRSLGAPLLLLCVALREARYAKGDARSPMVATLTANLLHIPIDGLLIFGLGWGISGAAWATVLSQGIELGLLAYTQSSAGFGLRVVERRHVREVWRLGWPLGAQFLLEVGAFTILVAILARIGEADLAAHHIVLQFTQASFLPALATGEAASILVGQAVGANRDDLVKPVARAALISAVAYTALCALVFAFGARRLVAPFAEEQTVAALAVKLCYIAAIFQVFDGASIVARSVLRGVGDVRFPAVLSVCTAWLCTPPLTYLLGVYFGLGAVGGWMGLCIEITCAALILWWRFEAGSWQFEAKRARQRVVDLSAPMALGAVRE